MRLINSLLVLLRLRAAEPVFEFDSTGGTRLERFTQEYEFYNNKGGYRNAGAPVYTVGSAKGLKIETFSNTIKGMLDALDAIERSLADRSTPNRKALRVVGESIAPQRERRLVDWMMTGEFFVYPDGIMGELLAARFRSVLTTMEELEKNEREGRYAFYIRFVDPLLEDCLALLRVLKTHYQ